MKMNITQCGDTITCAKKCTVTGDQYIIRVPVDKWRQWQSGLLIQDVFPELSAEQREFIMSGVTPAEWEDLFSEEKEKS